MSHKIRISSDLICSSDLASDRVKQLMDQHMAFIRQKMIPTTCPCYIDAVCLRDDVRTWLDSYPTKYVVRLNMIENCGYEIDIYDADVALLFKLSWGGA